MQALLAKYAKLARIIFAYASFSSCFYRMPKRGFNGTLYIRCTPEQTQTLLKLFKKQGVEPQEVGRRLVVTLCEAFNQYGEITFDEENGKIVFPALPDSTLAAEQQAAYETRPITHPGPEVAVKKISARLKKTAMPQASTLETTGKHK